MDTRIKLGSVSLEWYETDPGPCVECQQETGSGPIGFKLGKPAGPVCDECLVRLSKGLGNLLRMAHVAREVAEIATGIEDPWRADQCMVVLMTFAQLFNKGAKWPARPIGASQFLEQLQTRMANGSWQELFQSGSEAKAS